MTAEDRAFKLCRELEAEMRRMGIITTAHYSARTVDGRDLILSTLEEHAEAMAGRCLRTGNPWGTDTWMEGHPCPCASCQAWLRAVAGVGDEGR